MPNAIFKKDKFAIEIISKGSFIDDDPSFKGKGYVVETFVIRLNHVSLNEWILSKVREDQDSYETTEKWEAHCEERKARRAALEKRITEELDIDPNRGSVSITQSVSEIFTVVHIYEA